MSAGAAKVIEPCFSRSLEQTCLFQILVEYDDVEWQRREWLSPHRDAVFSFFLVEKGLYWAERPDPRHASLIAIDHHNHSNNNLHHHHHHHHHRINGKPLRGATAVANTVAWPALVSVSNYTLICKISCPKEIETLSLCYTPCINVYVGSDRLE